MESSEAGRHWGAPEIARHLRRRIADGEYAANGLLPSERHLAEEFGVNRRTVRRALDTLRSQGLVLSDSTRGHRVAPQTVGSKTLGLCLDSSIPVTERLIHALGGRGLIMTGFRHRLEREGWSFAVCDTSAAGYPTSTHDGANRALAGMAIWPTVPMDALGLQHLRELSLAMPVVLLDRRIHGFQSDFVGFDDYQAGLCLGKHLVELGHRRIGFIGWSVPETVHARLQGVEAALEHPLAEQWTLLSRSDGVPTDLFPQLLRPDRPTAVVCANDTIAVSLVSWLREHKVSVPDDVAVAGVGDSTGELLSAIGLTTVALPHYDLGWEAASMLLSRIHDPSLSNFPLEKRLPVHLVPRRTCGGAHSAKQSLESQR